MTGAAVDGAPVLGCAAAHVRAQSSDLNYLKQAGLAIDSNNERHNLVKSWSSPASAFADSRENAQRGGIRGFDTQER